VTSWRPAEQHDRVIEGAATKALIIVSGFIVSGFIVSGFSRRKLPARG
jgi:hypothetical protein